MRISHSPSWNAVATTLHRQKNCVVNVLFTDTLNSACRKARKRVTWCSLWAFQQVNYYSICCQITAKKCHISSSGWQQQHKQHVNSEPCSTNSELVYYHHSIKVVFLNLPTDTFKMHILVHISRGTNCSTVHLLLYFILDFPQCTKLPLFKVGLNNVLCFAVSPKQYYCAWEKIKSNEPDLCKIWWEKDQEFELQKQWHKIINMTQRERLRYSEEKQFVLRSDLLVEFNTHKALQSPFSLDYAVLRSAQGEVGTKPKAEILYRQICSE